MRKIFSTAAVHARDRFDLWHDVASKRLADHDSAPQCRHTFQAELQSGTLADVGLIFFETSAMSVARAAHHISHSSPDEIFVCHQGAGALALEQEGRFAVLAAGDVALLDPRLPYFGTFAEHSKLLVLKVPRCLVEARLGRTRDMMARSIRPLNAESRLTAAFLDMLPAHVEQLGAPADEIVRDQVLDLIAMSVAKAMDGRVARVSSTRSLALMNVRAAIEARLTDPDLDTETVAAAAGVSVRYANALLAQEDTSIMRLIHTRRLVRCRMALEDPSQGHRSISEIAYGWGFSDMTHFGRKFRSLYGQLPSEFRRNAKVIDR